MKYLLFHRSIQNYVRINGGYTCCLISGFKSCFEFFSCQIKVTYGVIKRNQIKRVETGGIFFAREGPTFVKKELNSFAICSAKCYNFLLIFLLQERYCFFPLFYRLFLLLFAIIPLYSLDISITFLYRNQFLLYLLTY